MPKFLSKVLLALMFVLPFTALAQERVTVSGKVTSAEDKQPLIGVTVVTETLSGMSTQLDGTYSVQAPAGTKLTFQYIGFKTVEFLVPTGSQAVTYNLEMESEAELVDDVVVIAYGVRKKGTVAGSVATVSARRALWLVR